MDILEISRYLVRASELLSVIVAIYYCFKFGKKNALMFPIYLIIVVFCEFLGWYLGENEMYEINVKLYRYVAFPIQYIFFFWYFITLLNKTKFNYYFWATTSIYILIWQLEYTYIPKHFFDKMALSNTFGSLIILVLVFIYFFRLISSNDILNFKKKQSFWISTGVLIYYLGSFPFYGAGNYIYEKSERLYLIYFQIVLLLALIMYLLFAASFIWGKEK